MAKTKITKARTTWICQDCKTNIEKGATYLWVSWGFGFRHAICMTCATKPGFKAEARLPEERCNG